MLMSHSASDGWSEIRLRGTLPQISLLRHLSCILLTVLKPTEAKLTLFREGIWKSQHLELELYMVVFSTKSPAAS
ncbi:hypothetical protein KQX54_001105 [Cotesia glomerata]|uniref:Uncharacterized protein n=1 Tax=Cotesia glomerata TaxID=32391 RepID=A0AAV7HRX9_COTGL|nr:hypothetical protein KQX54_001105 [Cotesia glomerata]